MSYAVLFPGQGSQFVGMGADVFDAHPGLLGERADAILGWSLRKMCLDGPADELTRTEHAQPALFAVSYALWLSFIDAVDRPPAMAAGHSLGEYSALAAAGAVGFDDGLRLVARRGDFMAAAADARPSGMAALLGADVETAEAVVAASAGEGGTLQIANLNAPGQVVVAGSEDDLAWLAEHGRDLGIRRVVPLKVAGAFHSSFMREAAERLGREIATTSFAAPRFDVIANSSATSHVVDGIPASLVDQVTSPVRFEETLRLIDGTGVGAFVHVGPGDVTAGLAKRTLPDVDVYTVSSLDEIESVTRALSTIDG